MKPEELRIGNFVYDVGGTIESRVIKLTEGKVLLNSPIPITEEWLVKFGFKKHIHKHKPGFQYIKWGRYRQIMTIHKPARTFKFGSWECNVKLRYVHQLQNLYFALKGKELMPV